jgi:hypothetical protein
MLEACQRCSKVVVIYNETWRRTPNPCLGRDNRRAALIELKEQRIIGNRIEKYYTI